MRRMSEGASDGTPAATEKTRNNSHLRFNGAAWRDVILPSGMKCARRLAGAYKPALSTSASSTSADSPRRPEPRPGRARFSCLPVLALLLGALSLFHAAPAAAQTVSFDVAAYVVHESKAEPTSITVRLSSAQAQSVTVGISVVDAPLTATAADYTLSATSVTFEAGSTLETITFLATADMMSEGNEVVTLRLTPPAGIGLGTHPDTGIIIFDDSRALPTLDVTPGSGTLALSWIFPNPDVALSGWDVHYTSAPKTGAGAVTNTAAATGTNAAAAWVAVTRTGTATSQTISGLNNGTHYRVRVRAFNLDDQNMRTDSGGWFLGTGTPVAAPAAAPAAPTGLTLKPGDTWMTVSWTAPSGTVTGYDVHYTSATAATVANDATVVSGFPPDEGWLDAVHGGTKTSHTLLHLDNGTTYRVRVRAVNAAGNSAWVFGSGTPVAPPSNADLSGLSAQAAGADGHWSALDLGAFSAGTTSYAVSVPHETTHARLTATAAHAKAALKAGAGGSLVAVSSGSAGAAVALWEGENALAVEVTAEDGTVKTYQVTVTRAAAPQGQQQQRLDPLTAALENVPSAHDGGEAFAIDLRFSGALGEGGVAPSAASFRVQAGSVAGVERVSAGLWRVRVQPKNWKDVTVTLAPPSDCAATGAVCTADGRALTNTVAATVGGPVRIRIEGGMAREGKDATLDFVASLHRAAAHEVSVDYATADRTATAGADYEAASGTLTFAPGETAATVSVTILDDEVDEGKETFELHLANARGAYLRSMHRKATGTIKNTDRMPAAWLARFGRAATDQVVDSLDARFDDAGHATEREVRLGGASLFGPPAGGARAHGEGGHDVAYGVNGALSAPGGHWLGSGAAAPGSPLGGMAHGAPQGAGGTGPAGHGTQGDVLRRLMLGSSFRTSAGDAESGRRLTAWGRAAGSFFAGDDGGLAVEGETTTVMLGADAAWSRWLAGVALARTVGTGSYQGAAGSGELSGTLTAVHPYARFRATDRLSAWGTLGLGTGELELETAAGGDWRTPTAMRMAAGGLRGVLLRGSGGLELAGRMDGRFTRMTSQAVSGETGDLAAATGDASRLRLLLEGSRPFVVDARRTLTPSVEVGLRQDGGDAETGMGIELGGALRFVDAQLGLAVDLAGRRLAAHADGGYEEWGASASVTLDPGASGRGLSLTLTPAWGAQAMGGAERLWSMTDARGLATGGYRTDAGMRLAGDVAWGFDAFGGRGAMAPYTGMTSSGYGRDWRAGVRWTVGPAVEFGFEATRAAASALAPVSHGLLLRFAWRPGAGLAPFMRGARQPDGSAMPDGAQASEPAPH